MAVMWLSFDPAKNLSNQSKHGFTLADAQQLEWEYLVSKPDDRLEYGEVRMQGFAPMGNLLLCVIYTDRGDDERRIISLRLATNIEKRDYVRFFNAP